MSTRLKTNLLRILLVVSGFSLVFSCAATVYMYQWVTAAWYIMIHRDVYQSHTAEILEVIQEKRTRGTSPGSNPRNYGYAIVQSNKFLFSYDLRQEKYFLPETQKELEGKYPIGTHVEILVHPEHAELWDRYPLRGVISQRIYQHPVWRVIWLTGIWVGWPLASVAILFVVRRPATVLSWRQIRESIDRDNSHSK